jgi:hypothetical protein
VVGDLTGGSKGVALVNRRKRMYRWMTAETLSWTTAFQEPIQASSHMEGQEGIFRSWGEDSQVASLIGGVDRFIDCWQSGMGAAAGYSGSSSHTGSRSS